MAGDVEGGLALRGCDDVRAAHQPFEHLREYPEEERERDLRQQRGHDGVPEDENLSQETGPVRAQLLGQDVRLRGQRIVLVLVFVDITVDVLTGRGAHARWTAMERDGGQGARDGGDGAGDGSGRRHPAAFGPHRRGRRRHLPGGDVLILQGARLL